MSKFHQIKQRGPIYLLPLFLASAAMRAAGNHLRVYWAKLNGIKVGGGLYLGPQVSWVNPSKITLGEKVSIAKGVRFWSELVEGKLTMGDNVLIARHCVIDFSGGLELEQDVLISEGAILYTHDHGLNPRSQPTGTSLVIESGAWIATGAVILPSVNRIGRNAVIGAGAVVSKDVPEGFVCVAAATRSFPRRDQQQSGIEL